MSKREMMGRHVTVNSSYNADRQQMVNRSATASSRLSMPRLLDFDTSCVDGMVKCRRIGQRDSSVSGGVLADLVSHEYRGLGHRPCDMCKHARSFAVKDTQDCMIIRCTYTHM